MVKLAHRWIAHARPKGPGQRRHIVAGTNVSPFAWARNICCGHKFCIRDRKDVSDSVQKHFVCATNVSQFAQHRNTQNSFSVARVCAPKKHQEQQCVRSNVPSFARALKACGRNGRRQIDIFAPHSFWTLVH